MSPQMRHTWTKTNAPDPRTLTTQHIVENRWTEDWRLIAARLDSRIRKLNKMCEIHKKVDMFTTRRSALGANNGRNNIIILRRKGETNPTHWI